jgi:hypothetical protein
LQADIFVENVERQQAGEFEGHALAVGADDAGRRMADLQHRAHWRLSHAGHRRAGD